MSHVVIINMTCNLTVLHPLDRKQVNSQLIAVYYTAVSSLKKALTPSEKQQSADLQQILSSLLL